MPKAIHDWTGLVEEVTKLDTGDKPLSNIFEELAAKKRFGEATAKNIKDRYYYELRCKENSGANKAKKEAKEDECNDSTKRELVGKQSTSEPPYINEERRGIGELRVGDIVTGWVDGIQPYGAFIVLPNGDTGLLHMSEMGTGILYDTIEDYVDIGQEIEVKIIARDNKGWKLSVKALGKQMLPKGNAEATPVTSAKPLAAPIGKVIPTLRSFKPHTSTDGAQYKKMFDEFLTYVSELEAERDRLNARVVELEDQLSSKHNTEHEAEQLLKQLRELVNRN